MKNRDYQSGIIGFYIGALTAMLIFGIAIFL